MFKPDPSPTLFNMRIINHEPAYNQFKPVKKRLTEALEYRSLSLYFITKENQLKIIMSSMLLKRFTKPVNSGLVAITCDWTSTSYHVIEDGSQEEWDGAIVEVQQGVVSTRAVLPQHRRQHK